MMKEITGPRSATFEEQAVLAGQVWANSTREQIYKERRRAAGGWPGTMSEARARVAQFVIPWSAHRGPNAPSAADREQVARILYASARDEWLRQRDEEETID